MKVLIKSQNENNGGLFDIKKKLKQRSIINEIEISKIKLNAPLINSI